MNGRVYDYNLGRFMSVDPLIQSPTSTQSVNPYSYIMNNPLAGTDPTGYACEAATGSHICKSEVKATVTKEGTTAKVHLTGGTAKQQRAVANTIVNGAKTAQATGSSLASGILSEVGSMLWNTKQTMGSTTNSNSDNTAGEVATAAGAASVSLSVLEHTTDGKALVPPIGDYDSTGQSRVMGKLEKVKPGKINQIPLKEITKYASRLGGALGAVAVMASYKANIAALEKGDISDSELKGKLFADAVVALIAFRGGKGGAIVGGAYFVADYVFSKDDVNGWIMIKRESVSAMENTQSSISDSTRELKAIRREYENNPKSVIYSSLGIDNINFGGE
ncbi:hypothetical protein SHAM105786_06500 [Shewanella amazonensis]|nr:RHS repeat-associated core domain-containing protein [Shewanella amazonensis]